MPNVTFIKLENFSEADDLVARIDNEEVVDAIKNDKPIPVTQEEFDRINYLTKLMLEGKF